MPAIFKGDIELPKQCDVAIIGAGIIGASAALEMAERGMKVAVFEKAFPACEQSGRNWGWCRQMGRDPRELPLVLESMQLWRQMNERTNRETGFVECGIAYLCSNEQQYEKRRSWHDKYVGSNGLSSMMISAQEASKFATNSPTAWVGGLYTPNDGRAEPQLATSAILEAARDNGAQVFSNCAARSLVRSAGKVSGLVTEKGEVACKAVLLAAGAWSRRFCINENIKLPQLSVVNSVMRSQPIEAGIENSLAGDKFAIRKRKDGGYTIAHAIYNYADIIPDSFKLAFDFLPLLKDEWRDFKYGVGRQFLEHWRLKKKWEAHEISAFEQLRILDPKPSSPILSEALASLKTALPQFSDVKIAQSWAGVIDVMPDAVPVIDEIDQVPGLVIATGFSGHGFGLGPGAGLLAAQLVCAQKPCVDPAPFAYGRF